MCNRAGFNPTISVHRLHAAIGLTLAQIRHDGPRLPGKTSRSSVQPPTRGDTSNLICEEANQRTSI